MRPWIGYPGVASPRFNMQQWTGKNTCTNCGSSDIVRRGQHRTKSSVYKTYQCKDCGHYNRALLADEGIWR